MQTRHLAAALAAVVMAAGAVAGAPRTGPGAARNDAPAAGLAQVWRLTTLTMPQRVELAALVRSLAGGGLRPKADRGRPHGTFLETRREALAGASRIVGNEAMARARALPSGPLAPEELLYFPVTSLADLSHERRAKIDAVFGPLLAEAREGATGRRGRAGAAGGAGKPQEGRRQRLRALVEVLDALLTREQLIAVKQFLPGQAGGLAARPERLLRMPSLTLQQEARVRALYASFDDETAADRARREAIRNELAAGGTPPDRRRELAAERREVERRIGERRAKAYEELSKVLTPDQMAEARAATPGPPRPLVFVPERIRALSLTPEQRRRVAGALRAFRSETRDERRELGALRQKAKEGDIRSMEAAPLRGEIRKNAGVVEAGRDELVRAVADALTGEQLAQLVREAGRRAPSE